MKQEIKVLNEEEKSLKPAFYEPSVCMCTPDNPNTMGVCVTLTEPVNGAILHEAVERLRERFYYFYVRVKLDGNNLIVVPNDLPVVIRDTWDPILLCSAEANYHLLSFKYEGNRLTAEISHSITDGAGFLPYFKSLLYYYLSTITGQELDPSGFRLLGDEIPDAETGNPFAGLDLDAAEEPLYQKPPVTDYFRLGNPEENGKRECTAFYLRFPEEQVMQYCKENDGSPNVLFSVLLAKAARRYDPADEKTVSCLISVDMKSQLGNHENYRMFIDTAYVDMPKEQDDYDIPKACTKARGQLILQAQPENVMYTLKTRKAGYEKMEQMPLQMCVDVLKPALGAHRASFCVSYANSRSFGPLDLYIQEIYLLSEPNVTDVMVELSCINHHFFAMFGQPFSSEEFFRAFLAELDDAGIPYEIMRKEPFRLCGVRYDDIEGVRL